MDRITYQSLSADDQDVVDFHMNVIEQRATQLLESGELDTPHSKTILLRREKARLVDHLHADGEKAGILRAEYEAATTAERGINDGKVFSR